MSIEKRLKKLNITLPKSPIPIASYVTAKTVGKMVYISGQGPILNGEQKYAGKLGAECSIEEGQEAARICALNLLSQLKQEVDSLDNVKEIVHLKGLVASTNDFYMQPQVMNGASDFMIEVFGEKGKHTRCAYGTNVLPGNIPVEVEMIAEIY